MPGNLSHIDTSKGLSDAEIPELQRRFGKNIFQEKDQHSFYHLIINVVREPMFLLLVFATILYLVLGNTSEGFMMMVGVVFISTISIYQENRGAKALKLLEKYTEPKVRVIRGGVEQIISSVELVPGDLIILEEGNPVPADATIVDSNDLSVNESVITGESMPAEKNKEEGSNLLYLGTTVNSGRAYANVTAIGNATVLGKIGKSISAYSTSVTLLQKQIRVFVKRLTYLGVSAFLLIWILNYLKTGLLVESLLLGLTLAVAAIPEEIPVAFTSFMALGAYHMARLGIISKQPQTIENLGAISVVCLDKTGTITENKMTVKAVYDFEHDLLIDFEKDPHLQAEHVLYYSLLASEKDPFDAMEKAIYEANNTSSSHSKEQDMEFIYEYPLKGTPPMMTHVYRYRNVNVVAAKGAAEKILQVCSLDAGSLKKVSSQILFLTIKGYRVLGVASAIHAEPKMPANQEDFNWKFEGLVALYDPPRKNIHSTFSQLYKAGIRIKILSGDYPETVVNIAEQVGLKNRSPYLTGERIMQLTMQELRTKAEETDIFARMFPDAKLRVVEALKSEGEIVCMIGDGVNDAPALKTADIGIAMGDKGTEIARRASDLVLTDDNIEKLAEAIRQGRKIYSNLKKALRYIVSIHIPIILVASLPLILGWKFPNIFTLVHVLFLELIMGPTCSIFFEREPVEADIMDRPPRDRTIGMFSRNEILISSVQGIIIAGGVLLLYYNYMQNGYSINTTRAMVFTTLVLSNILLTLTNRSFSENLGKTIRYKNNLAPWVVILSISLLVITQVIPFIRDLFGFEALRITDILLCAGVSIASVLWFEGYKTNHKDLSKENEPKN